MADVIHAEAGESAYSTVERAISMARHWGGEWIVVHNDIEVSVSGNSSIYDILTIFDLKRQLARYKAGYHDE